MVFGWFDMVFLTSKRFRVIAKYALFAPAVCVTLIGSPASAEPERKASWRVADAFNACLIDCANQEQSCKRLCPATYNTPCMGACENQVQFCRQSCQRK
jgi:hypothetical protein